MNYLLDTHHAIALWRAHPALLATVAAHPDASLHLCRPVIGEMWYRIYNTPNPAENEKTLLEFLRRYPVLDFDEAATVEFGLIKTAMQRIRRPIPDVDAQLAAIARTREWTILSAEQHFSAIPRVMVANWLAEAARAVEVTVFRNTRQVAKSEGSGEGG